ncbi:hypothetical protein M2347_002307 [Chryseobacterium sp. H1D6B]|uniref:hypothetical protein n=1 Tax=Chryseobacterium sp. H1D6B TaxID=2940588 RepID=UPI0015C858B7|nr:hypothetical protein [Chryseobacterium sp. H1D6B]MDH6252580.1 hypothetical protein [Chryseobacterium sp. H1D6B]
MKKLLSLFFLLPFLYNAQITINYTAKKITNSRKIILHINITNESNDKYVIPIDTTGFRVYYRDEICSNFFFGGSDRGLGLTLLFENNKEYIDGQSGGGYISDESFEKDKKYIAQSKNYKKKLNKWKVKYNIKADSTAEKNKYFFENLIFLKPRQTLVFKRELDPNLFNQDKNLILFNTYYLQPEKQYMFSLFHCVDKNSYNSLTDQQKRELTGYRFFTGNIESKWVSYSFTKEEYLEN